MALLLQTGYFTNILSQLTVWGDKGSQKRDIERAAHLAKDWRQKWTESFTKWDVTADLHTEEDARLYLEACAEEDPGDGSLICTALNDIARAGI